MYYIIQKQTGEKYDKIARTTLNYM